MGIPHIFIPSSQSESLEILIKNFPEERHGCVVGSLRAQKAWPDGNFTPHFDAIHKILKQRRVQRLKLEAEQEQKQKTKKEITAKKEELRQVLANPETALKAQKSDKKAKIEKKKKEVRKHIEQLRASEESGKAESDNKKESGVHVEADKATTPGSSPKGDAKHKKPESPRGSPEYFIP